MQNSNYKNNKVEYEIALLEQKKISYLENIKKNKVSKKNMILYPILPIIMGVVGCAVYTVMFKTLPTPEIYSAVGVAALALECVFSSEEIEQIINYTNSKKVLEEINIQELEKEISEKEKEKTKLLDKKTKSLDNNTILSNDAAIVNSKDLYLDNTMHFLPETKEKVLIKNK